MQTIAKIRDGTISEIVYCSKTSQSNNYSSQITEIKSHQLKSHPNQITCFQIKSFVLKSNRHLLFNHDLNQIVIWICPSLQGRRHGFQSGGDKFCERSE